MCELIGGKTRLWHYKNNGLWYNQQNILYGVGIKDSILNVTNYLLGH